MKLIFLDTETTGLDPEMHEVWEVGAIVREYDDYGTSIDDEELHWFLPLFNFQYADPFALDIGKFWDRYRWPDPQAYSDTYMSEWCRMFMQLTKGAYIVGAVPNFDIERLDRLCKRYGYRLFNHYHLVDVEAMCAGYLREAPPWKSEDIFGKLGMDMESREAEKHTALGDARVVRDVYDLVMLDAKKEVQEEVPVVDHSTTGLHISPEVGPTINEAD